MIHPARLTVSPVANIVFCYLVLLDLKSGDGCTDRRTTCVKTMIPTGRDCGLAEWINYINYVININLGWTMSVFRHFQIRAEVWIAGLRLMDFLEMKVEGLLVAQS